MLAGLAAMLWVLTAMFCTLIGTFAFHLADFGGRPSFRADGVVASRRYAAPSASLEVATTVSPNGQVGTALVPTSDPATYEVCVRIGQSTPCVHVRPARFELLRPGIPVLASIRSGRLSGWLRVQHLIEDEG